MAYSIEGLPEGNPFMRRFHRQSNLGNSELKQLSLLCDRPQYVPRGKELLPDAAGRTVVILDGYCSDYRPLANGKQVIFDFRLPGDIACLRNIVFRCTRQRLITTTEAIVSFIPTGEIWALVESSPPLKKTFSERLDADDANLADRFAHIARSSTVTRMAAFLLNLLERLDVVGLVKTQSFPLAITQQDMADALGVTPVHVSRTLRHLRDHGIATVSGGRAVIYDLPSLRALSS